MDKDNFISFYDYKKKILERSRTTKKTKKKSMQELMRNVEIVREKKRNGQITTTRETMDNNDLPKLE